jgi:hypothetical protein
MSELARAHVQGLRFGEDDLLDAPLRPQAFDAVAGVEPPCCADPGRSTDPMRHPGAVGRQCAAFVGLTSDYRFSWFSTGDGSLVLFVGDARVEGEPDLGWVRAVGERRPGGYLVGEAGWDAHVLPSGRPRR